MHKNIQINNLTAINEFVNCFKPEERALLIKILSEKCNFTNECVQQKKEPLKNGFFFFNK